MRRISGFNEWSTKIEEKDCGCNGGKILEKTNTGIKNNDFPMDSLAGFRKYANKHGIEKAVDVLVDEENESIVEKKMSPDDIKEMVKKGYSLPDGSFPIKNESDLRKAIKAYGRAKDQTSAAKHIAKRAKALGKSHLIPHTEDFQKSLKS